MQRYYTALCQSEKDMRKWLAILVLLTGLLACNKEKFEKQIEGNYTGTFQRTSPTGFYPQQQVSLNLNNNSFSGQSTNARQPAICHGSWEAGSGTIEFVNGCVWTADFDWTLILEGKFNYQLNGNHLKIWKTVGEVTDAYELEKAQ
jgi:hypothetical protein